MIYLLGGSYESIQDLAEENWQNKEVIRDRFHGNKDRFLSSQPLPNKLSGVCHMATGTGKSFVIFSGSTIVGIDKETDTIGPGMKQQRGQIIKEGKAQEVGEGWKLTEDVLANSPSRAGEIVLGRRNNGWTTWKNEDGETLKEVEREGQ